MSENEIEIMDPDGYETLPSVAPAMNTEMTTQILLAHRFPRNERRSVTRAKSMATENKDIAESCFYSLPRSNKRIVGPSVRLAEIMASTWGNLHVVVRQGDEADKWVTAVAHAYDMESLTSVSVEKRRRITTKDGQRYGDDMITNTANAVASITFRDAVFRVIPRCYVNEVYEAAREVALDGAKSMAERRTNAVKWWETQGVDSKKLLDHFGYKGVDELTVDDLDYLTGLRTGIKQRDYDVSDIFDRPRGEREVASVSIADVVAAPEQPTESVKANADTSPKPKPKPKTETAPPVVNEAQMRDALYEEICTRTIPGKEWDALMARLGINTREYNEIPAEQLPEVLESVRKTFAKIDH